MRLVLPSGRQGPVRRRGVVLGERFLCSFAISVRETSEVGWSFCQSGVISGLLGVGSGPCAPSRRPTAVGKGQWPRLSTHFFA